MIKQLRSSGGMWLRYRDTDIMIDPGPGALVRCARARPKLDATTLDAVILTHQHLDHSNDINVMIEAMTEGGFKKRGAVYAPREALDPLGGVIFEYVKKYPETVSELKPGKFTVGDITFEVPCRNRHSVETYGLKFYIAGQTVSLVSDTKYFGGLIDTYRDSDVLILNVVFKEPRDQYDHLSLPEAIEIVKKIKPKLAVLTHFGMGLIKMNLRKMEERSRKETGLNIICAYDGFSIELPYKG